MLQHHGSRNVRTPGQPIRVVIESERLAAAVIRPLSVGGVDVVCCSGPTSDHEVCPLVTKGRCPAGDCDVVVSSLRGPWAASIHNAWVAQHTVAARIADDVTAEADAFDAHLGAALIALFRASYGIEEAMS